MYARVYVEITNICNMACSFCHGHSRTPRRMSEEEFSRVLDALQGQTNFVYYHLMGEPLTHPLAMMGVALDRYLLGRNAMFATTTYVNYFSKA